MTAVEPTSRSALARGLTLLLGLASSAGFLYLASRRITLSDLERTLSEAQLWPWLPLAVLCYLLGHLVRGLRCQRLVSGEARLSWLTATHVVVLGYAVNNLLPARLGELARAGMLAERSGLPFVQGLSLTFLERVLDGLVMLGLLLLALAALPGVRPEWLEATLGLGAALFTTALLVVLAAVLAPSLLLRWTSRLTQNVSSRIHDAAVRQVDSALRGVAHLGQPGAALPILGLSVLTWLCEAGLFLCLLPALGMAPDPRVALLAMTVTNLGILVPSSPGFIGPFHYFCMQALAAVGVAEARGLSYAALVHLGFYVPITLWGLGILLGYGVQLSQAVRDQRRATPGGLFDGPLDAPGALPDPESTPTLLALCDGLIPHGTEGDAARAEALPSAARFTAAQLLALPLRLRILFALGFGGFRALTWLRFGRPLTRLTSAQRARWVSGFAYGRVGLLRQLMRAPRATAVLAYYEHPRLRAALLPSAPQGAALIQSASLTSKGQHG